MELGLQYRKASDKKKYYNYTRLQGFGPEKVIAVPKVFWPAEFKSAIHFFLSALVFEI